MAYACGASHRRGNLGGPHARHLAPARPVRHSEKGGASVYGLGRFPVTLYQEQWTKFLDMADDIRAFIQSNEASLKTKS